jgi:glycosyltransferase involved in cell wall biosynthesis
MRILMLVPHEDARGPVAKHTGHLVIALRSLGCTVVTHPWGQHTSGESILHKLVQRPRDVLSVYRAVQPEAFDMVVVKTSHDWRTLFRDIPVVLAIRRRCRPVILQLHGSRSSCLTDPGFHAFKAATALLLRLVDGVFVLSTEEERQWRAFRPRLRVFTVKNPYIRTFPVASEPLPHPSVSQHRVLFVGRLIRAKGIFDLVRALPDVLAQTDCQVVIVGEGDHERELRDEIKRLHLEKHVTLTGYLTGPELIDRYREATIFVLPTSWDEGFPTVLAEAMDAGLPIVTTRLRGAADHLVPNENALFVEAGNVDELGSAITTLLDNHDLRTRMATANRIRIRMFEPGVVASEYRDALESIGLSLVKDGGSGVRAPDVAG